MTTAAAPLAVDGAHSPPSAPLAWGLSLFIWLLPLHTLAITVLFGGLGLSATTVRLIAGWKELLIGVLFASAVTHALLGGGAPQRVHWLDLAVTALGCLALGYLMGANLWFGSDLPLGAQLYGARDTVFVSLLYFVGRASPEIAEHPRVLRALFVVGVVTSAIAVVERILVTPQMLVLLGAARYVQDFLGASAITAGNVYGLPDNYWTDLGGHLVQRAGSTYMSAQGFAIPFLVILPAATLWVLSAARRRRTVRWIGYLIIWAGLLLTLTRMTIVICLLQTVVVAAARRQWSVLAGLGFVCVTGLGVALALAPGLASFAWATLTWQTGSSASHLTDWSEGLENFASHPLGVGLGSTDFVAARFGLEPLTGDNQYLKYGIELGALGLFLHVAVLVGALASGVRAWRAAREKLAGAYGLLLLATVLGIALNALTAVVLNALMLAYVFFWLAGSVTTIAQRWDGTTT